MPSYKIAWYIDVEADTPEEAAEEALGMQRDPESTATIFTVIDCETDKAICYDAVEKMQFESDYPNLSI